MWGLSLFYFAVCLLLRVHVCVCKNRKDTKEIRYSPNGQGGWVFQNNPSQIEIDHQSFGFHLKIIPGGGEMRAGFRIPRLSPSFWMPPKKVRTKLWGFGIKADFFVHMFPITEQEYFCANVQFIVWIGKEWSVMATTILSGKFICETSLIYFRKVSVDTSWNDSPDSISCSPSAESLCIISVSARRDRKTQITVASMCPMGTRPFSTGFCFPVPLRHVSTNRSSHENLEDLTIRLDYSNIVWIQVVYSKQIIKTN